MIWRRRRKREDWKRIPPDVDLRTVTQDIVERVRVATPWEPPGGVLTDIDLVGIATGTAYPQLSDRASS